MQGVAERLGGRLNEALRGVKVDVARLARSWPTMSAAAYEASEARLERAHAVETWAREQQSPRIGARVAGFVPGLWNELVVAAVAHNHPAGFMAVWSVVSYTTQVRFIATASDRSALAGFLRSDPSCLRRLLLSVPAGDDETFATVLEYVAVGVHDLRFANTPERRRLIVRHYYQQFFN